MNDRSQRTRLRPGRIVSLSLLAAVVAACGSGGGGGGSKGPPNPVPATNVEFTGFTFRIGGSAPTAVAPFENLGGVPPTLGAPLDVVVIFNFDGVPAGPFHQQNLPVYTTPADITPSAGASAGNPIIPAKGTYVLVGNTVEFKPFIPTAAMQLALSAPPEAVPGFLPSSLYTAKVVSTAGLKISNLKGPGGLVQFGTTSLPAGYFSGDDTDNGGPHVVSVTPPDGTLDFYPSPFSNFAPGSPVESFPAGPEFVTVTFDRAIEPSAENLGGHDWDGDGYPEPNLFMRAQSTRLLIAQTVPAGSSIGNAAAFPALAGLTADEVVPANGGDIFLHNSQGGGALPGADPVLSAVPSSLALARDSDLLYVILRVDGGADRLAVADHVMGDPSFADLAATSLDTGLADLVGLTMLLDGRLVAYDASTRRLYELMPEVIRHRPLGEPELVGLTIGNGSLGFASDMFPAGVEVLDLAQSPTGDLYGLVLLTGGTFPQIVPLAAIDPDLNDAFLAGEGLPSGVAVQQLADHYAAIAFLDAATLFGLNRGADTIDTLDLQSGVTGTLVQGASAYGVPLSGLPGSLAPALDLAVGFMDLDVNVSVLSNSSSGAVVRLEPVGVLPIGSRIDVMQRYAFASSKGVSQANEDPGEPKFVLGAEQLLTVTTSSPINTVGPCAEADPEDRVNDVLDEKFSDTAFEDTTPTGLSPLAEWATPVAGGATSGHLRASVGADEETILGNFAPQPYSNFDPSKAYSQSPDNIVLAHFRYVFLDTDAQNFPLPNGETPDVTQNSTVFGGDFRFHDFIIPAGVWVRATGTRPLQITATGRVEIAGVLDISGSPGVEDVTFDSAFVPVPGGSGGAGAGRGGDGHPTIQPPSGAIKQVANVFVTPYATPETAEHGLGAVLTPSGGYFFSNVGGRGGLSTLGYDPDDQGFPNVKNTGSNTELHRPPGGGGGSFLFHGIKSHNGSGAYRVQSSSSWFNYTLCPTNDKIHDAIYGMEELQFCFAQPPTPLQCVYMIGTPENPERFQPPAEAGDLVFSDGNPDNDYFGGDGELQVLFGGQGGGGGGTRVDSMKHILWSGNQLGLPQAPLPIGPPCYPNLSIGFLASPASYDAKGGGGGGGGGTVRIRSFGEIRVTRTGHIYANGGDGAGGETIGNSNYAGGGGGGSGGAVILQAAAQIIVEADSNHRAPGFTDGNGAEGASIDVSGGMGWDARTSPNDLTSKPKPTYEFTRSDGGQGGFGLIQLQEGAGDGMPTVKQGAYLFARQRAVSKRYSQQQPLLISSQNEHISWSGGGNNKPPDILRYIDILYYRAIDFDPSQSVPANNPWVLLNGADPPIIATTNAGTLGPFTLDTPMMDYFGKRVVREPQPQKFLQTYNGYDAAFKEIAAPGQMPGTTYLPTDEIPLSIWLKEPDGTPLLEDVEGQTQFAPWNVVDRLPVVHPSKTPPEFGTVSRGTSKWLDFNGVALRARDATGLAPPLFPGINGTYNDLLGVPPPGKDGLVVTANEVVGAQPKAHFVDNTGPLAPGLCGAGPMFGDPEFNDIKVDAPEISKENAITDNATVQLVFQGAFPVRAGSHIPDPDTLTAWVSDLRELSGHPLVRFQVVFDVSKDPNIYPFTVDSPRPAVDQVRVRARY